MQIESAPIKNILAYKMLRHSRHSRNKAPDGIIGWVIERAYPGVSDLPAGAALPGLAGPTGRRTERVFWCRSLSKPGVICCVPRPAYKNAGYAPT
jgi:hypothetical protein